MSPHHLHWQKLEERLDMRLDSLVPVRENRLCWIFRGRAHGEPVIVRQYKRECREGALREARAVERYGEACESVPSLLPLRVLASNQEEGTLCINLIEGELLSDAMRRPLTRARREAVLAAVGDLGRLLARLRELTVTAHEPSSFLEEYLLYTSHRLASVPLLGPVLFGDAASDATRLFEELRQAGEPSSLSHGDLVFANMIFDGRSLGLIDFTNANFESHTLDDLYTFQVTCDNLWHLSSSVRFDLSNALRAGLGRMTFDSRTHRFYWEYHRRRWLTINLNGGISHWLKFVLALPRMTRRLPVSETLALA